jgi:cytochrome c oxidase subunit 3
MRVNAVETNRAGTPQVRDESTAFVGMVIFLGSWAVMFIALFFAYGFVRLRATTWPSEDLPRLPLLLPALNTVVIGLSSATLQYGLSALRRGRELPLAPALAASALLGFGFLALQWLLWTRVRAAGLHNSTGTYASVFFMLTTVHAAHVLVGLVALVSLAIRAMRGAFSAARHLPVRLWTMYWHFVGIVWGCVFVSVFLL